MLRVHRVSDVQAPSSAPLVLSRWVVARDRPLLRVFPPCEFVQFGENEV